MVLQLKSALSGGEFSKMKNIAVIFPDMPFSKKQKMDKYKHFHPFRPFLEKKSENIFKKLLKLDSVCAMLRPQNEGTQRRALPN